MQVQTLNVNEIRKDFPTLSKNVNNHKLVYLDNAATTQKPRHVIKAVQDYYENYNSNVHRGIHTLSEEATLQYEEAHKKVASFINAGFEEVIFTKGTTESINLLAYSLSEWLKENDEIILTEMEHHANLVPWQQLAKRKKLRLKFARIKEDYTLDMDHFKSLLNENTKIVSVCHASNVFGTINDVKKISELAHEYNALVIADSAQVISHMKIDVKDLDVDFLAFSGHKMLAPTGIGVLYGRKELLKTMQPFLFGGDMIKEVTFEESKWNDLPWKFEAGTPNISSGIGLGVAVEYLKNVGMNNIKSYTEELGKYALEKLKEVPGIELYNPEGQKTSVISFNLKGVHSHDVATLLNHEGIAIRAGHHCAMPLMNKLNLDGTSRISLYFYNTEEEIDKLVESLKKIVRLFE